MRKDFSSLKKHRHSGVLPKNLLAGPTQRIQIPTAETINSGALYVVRPLDLSEKVRSQDIKTCFFLPLAIIDSGIHEQPAFSLDVTSVEYNGTTIVSTGERDLVLNLSKNGQYLYFTRCKAYIDKMVIPKDALRHVWMSNDDRNVLFVLQKKFGLIYVRFAAKSPELHLLFQRDQPSWIAGKFVVEDANIVAEMYNQRRQKREKSLKDPEMVVKLVSSPESSQIISDHTCEDANLLGASDNVLLNGLPNVLKPAKIKRRQTRAISKMMEKDSDLYAIYSEKSVDYEEDEDDEEIADDDAPIIQETPAPFDPPLRYTLKNGKKFIVAYNDFKTLYNNDWINDTLIDFFIAYDIDRAEHELHLIQENEVYAFNSFFFTKLMSKTDDQETPQYYANIRRWLTKLDLMSYERVVLPINEHLHWFCAIIKNLPALVEAATEYNRDPKKGQINEATGKKYRVEPVVEVFVLDSLRQSHSNIAGPLKTLIDEYCRDKYNVPIPPELIRVQSARVPKQRNFNDCGIHVIYNVRKWLSEPSVCEKVWRKFGKSQRAYFSGSERNNMRRSSIDTLLELHTKQMPQIGTSAEEESNDHSDDEIELISYHSSKPEVEIQDVNSEKKETEKVELDKENVLKDLPNSRESPATESSPSQNQFVEKSTPGKMSTSKNESNKATEAVLPDAGKSRSTTPVRTLDPRVFKAASSPYSSPRVKSSKTSVDYLSGETKERSISNLSYQIEHPFIRRLCMNIHVKQHAIDFLNRYFINHSKKYDPFRLQIIEFVKNYNFFDPSREKDQCDLLILNFREQLQEPPAPVDEPFVIQEADDSNSELNQSVNDLRILNDDRKLARNTATPEATRKFMREADQISPIRQRKVDGNPNLDAISTISPPRHTRSWDQQDDEDSDLEVLGDETLRIVSSETSKKSASLRRSSKSFSTPPEQEKRKNRKTTLGSQPLIANSFDTVVSISDEDDSVKGSKVTRDSKLLLSPSTSTRDTPAGSKRRKVESKVKLRHAYK